MAGLWQRTGNVTVTNGSKIVTGFGTKWKTGTLPIQKGHTFYGPDNAAYEVDTVVSDTEILLVDTYRGGTMANQPYRIDITRTSTISQFAADLASLVAKYRTWFDGMMTWLTGSGDVAILNPDTGANVTIPSWKKVASEGEGQTARAKVEADRAKTEADRAFTEADRAAGIVAAAALPLPDVWAPLSDSLRLITGYGRDVVVGADVVARMVNFSRSTTKTYWGKDGQFKVAASNEPAFELEGLLLEGQSQNLVVYSEGATFFTANASFQTLTNNVSGVLPMTGQRISFATNNGETNANLIQTSLTLTGGQTYTYSTHLKVETGDTSAPENCIGVYAANGLNIGARAVIRKTGDGIYRVSVPFTVNGTGSQMVFIRFNRIGAPSAVWTAVVGGVQLENLPFASSYIPTNGAAVTRAADVCWIPNALNVTPDYGDITIAMEVRRNLAIPSSVFPRAIHISDRQFVVADSARIMARGGGLEQVNISTAAPGTRERIAATIKGNTIACFLNGTKATLPQTPIFPVSNGTSCFIGSRNGLDGLFGHVRNVRIWQRTLSDEQIKAAA
ncbi:phage head spike fiber domain-containing protein [Aeromonas caviae]|uniref:phage head spike fiber domain-containing protein n=1 Tax=Aeromonas caviae TaxID=648 RepID=UPI0029D47971|nr:LamG-like jellyroll fold domain-containing protein [Aeromonas caviae]MDX7704724.1 LamG-like jellyroll fold domain-containing protein [Aeromonas caviae]MDX7793260.1 LamG-like jellyroll fold domain-containing protein [Aeromonas caviae]